MPATNNHGGQCCGMGHVWSFHGPPTPFSKEQLDVSIAERLRQFTRGQGLPNGTSWGHCFEVVLTDQQMILGWAAVLKERKFRLVNRFYNSNSGNYCNVLHLTTGQPRGKNRSKPPYQW